MSAARDAGRRGPGLAGRLLTTQVLVMVAGGAAATVTAATIGPALFHEHLLRAGDQVTDAQRHHVEEAFTSAGIISLSAALAAALIAATAATWFVVRRIRRSLGAVTRAAAQVRSGHYDVEVPSGGAAELDTLAAAFNDMAAKLGRVEETRRRLLTDLAHELRTPIATLDGYLEGLEDEVVPWGPRTAALLRSQTARLARLADDLRAVSQAEEGALTLHPAPCRIAALVEDASAAASEAYQRKEVALRTHGCAGEVVVDRHRIGQVLANLLSNALRHTPPGGTVDLAAELSDGSPSEAASIEWRTVRITVTDTGEGLTAEHLPHVFDRFYRTDPQRGTGVGLTICRALVEAHGGRIGIASAGPGRGATVTVVLPRSSPDRQPGAPSDVVRESAR